MKERIKTTGFTLLECLVATFILLVGMMGVVAVFNAGITARLQAQEMVVSSELATMWGDWTRTQLGTGGLRTLLNVDRHGNFFTDVTGIDGLPTLGCNAYQGYLWRITASDRYAPQWLGIDGRARDCGTRQDGASTGATISPLTKVTLTVTRGARTYNYYFVFSGVQLQFGKPG